MNEGASQAEAAQLWLELPVALRQRFTRPRLLGQGAMGMVFAVRDKELARPVALKILAVRGAMAMVQKGELEARFLREAQLGASVRSPHVVELLDYGSAEGRQFMVSDWVEGEDLRRKVKRARGGLPPAQALEWTRQIFLGLGAIHEAGILHRDLKPANVLVGAGGQAKIADFGLARGEESETLTRTGTLVGTPFYIPPEVFDGTLPDARADVYAAGVLGVYLLQGQAPFEGVQTPTELWARKRELRQLELAGLGVPPGAQAFLERAICPDPAERPADGAAAAVELTRILESPEELAGALGPVPRGGASTGAFLRSSVPEAIGVAPPARRASGVAFWASVVNDDASRTMGSRPPRGQRAGRTPHAAGETGMPETKRPRTSRPLHRRLTLGLQAVLVGGGYAAIASGEAEEEVVERVVPEQVIEAHEAERSGQQLANEPTVVDVEPLGGGDEHAEIAVARVHRGGEQEVNMQARELARGLGA